jgi:hypothetical protein
MISVEDRHPATQHLARWLTPNMQLPPEALAVSTLCWDIGGDMIARLPDGPELSEGLRKLLEAKDCFVRAAIGAAAAAARGPGAPR